MRPCSPAGRPTVPPARGSAPLPMRAALLYGILAPPVQAAWRRATPGACPAGRVSHACLGTSRALAATLHTIVVSLRGAQLNFLAKGGVHPSLLVRCDAIVRVARLFPSVDTGSIR